MLATSATVQPTIVGWMIYDVEQDNSPVGNGIEASMEGRQVDAIEVRHSVLLTKVARNLLLPHDLAPLGSSP